MQVYTLQTGTVRVKEHHRTARYERRAARFANVVLDRRYTDPLPVYVWVIDHPEGIIVVDTGVTSALRNPDHLDPGNRWFLRHDSRFDIQQDQELRPGLERIGVDPIDVRWVVLTHLHVDHTEGLRDVPDAEILVAKREYDFHLRLPIGSSVASWPDNIAIRLIDHHPTAFGPFGESWPLTDSGDVVLVPTPGHTPGHQSVILTADEHTIFFAGDTSFDERQLLVGECGGIVWDTESTRESIARIKQFATDREVVYLPTHDPAAADRLEERVPLSVHQTPIRPEKESHL